MLLNRSAHIPSCIKKTVLNLKREGGSGRVSDLELKGLLVRDSTEALCCVLEKDTLSSAYATYTLCHPSQKSSLRGVFSHFRLRIQVLLSLAMFSHGLSMYCNSGLRGHYGLPRMIVHSLRACHILLGPLTFCCIPIKFFYVLSSPVRIFYGEM